MAQSPSTDDDEGMELSMNIDWTSTLSGIRTVIAGIIPWGYLAAGILVTDNWYSRRQRR